MWNTKPAHGASASRIAILHFPPRECEIYENSISLCTSLFLWASEAGYIIDVWMDWVAVRYFYRLGYLILTGIVWSELNWASPSMINSGEYFSAKL